jgi:DNA-binding GntR family transcriptional regulator
MARSEMLLSDGARSLRHHVTERLRDAIVTGELKPGERLGQDRLSQEFGVSSGPVREALRHLENEGLVEYFPNRGCFVMELTDDELVNVVLPIRLTLERHAAERYVAEHKAPFAELREIVDRMRAAADLRALVDLDMAFHETLVVGSGQAHTIQLWRGIYSRIRTQLHRFGPAHANSDEIVVEHQELLDVLESGKARAIASTLNKHITQAAVSLIPKA